MLASNSLSHRHFTTESEVPEDMSKEHITSHAMHLWDMRMIDYGVVAKPNASSTKCLSSPNKPSRKATVGLYGCFQPSTSPTIPPSFTATAPSSARATLSWNGRAMPMR